MTKKILYVDDDKVMHMIVQKTLGSDFEVHCTTTIEETKNLMLKSNFDLILIDRILPDGDGMSLCQHIREDEKYSALPIVFVSGKDTEADKVSCLFAGGDDYITKPFSPIELKARISARLRNFKKKLSLGKIEIDQDTLRVFLRHTDGQKKELFVTHLEYKLLVLLISNPDSVFSRQLLLNRLWGNDLSVTDRVVDTHISHLRKKIQNAEVQIQAIPKEGYKIIAA
jgi:two-component system alkaline phosphatase synthesis response regulator PhoP